MNRKNAAVPILIVLAVLVWGNALYRLFAPSSDGDETAGTERPSVIALNDTTAVEGRGFVYTGAYRDPFRDRLRAEPADENASAPKRERKIPEPEKIFPKLRFSGVIRDGGGILALVEDPEGNVRFVGENDTVSGVRIASIRKDTLVCIFGKKRFLLGLEP
jgi:Tfp pilus assembly protein PilP